MNNIVDEKTIIMADFEKRSYWLRFLLGIFIDTSIYISILWLFFKILFIGRDTGVLTNLCLISAFIIWSMYFYLLKFDIYKITLDKNIITFYYYKWFKLYISKYNINQLEFRYGLAVVLKGGFYTLYVKDITKSYFKSFDVTIRQDMGFNTKNWTKKNLKELYDKLIEYQKQVEEQEEIEIKLARKKYWENKHQENNLT